MNPSGVPEGFGIIGQPQEGQALEDCSDCPGNAAEVQALVTAVGGFAADKVVIGG